MNGNIERRLARLETQTTTRSTDLAATLEAGRSQQRKRIAEIDVEAFEVERQQRMLRRLHEMRALDMAGTLNRIGRMILAGMERVHAARTA